MTNEHDICQLCTFELTPERVCDRDYCPNAFMKRTGKTLSLTGVMQQFEREFAAKPKMIGRIEDIDFSGFIVPNAALSCLSAEAREQFDAYRALTDQLPTFEEAAKDIAERRPSFMLAEDVRVPQPKAAQPAGTVVLTRAQADWLRAQLLYIRAGLFTMHAPEQLREQEFQQLDEIEQALK